MACLHTDYACSNETLRAPCAVHQPQQIGQHSPQITYEDIMSLLASGASPTGVMYHHVRITPLAWGFLAACLGFLCRFLALGLAWEHLVVRCAVFCLLLVTFTGLSKSAPSALLFLPIPSTPLCEQETASAWFDYICPDPSAAPPTGPAPSYKCKGAGRHQIWFDTPGSLAIKYAHPHQSASLKACRWLPS